jgi:hypothetical protein
LRSKKSEIVGDTTHIKTERSDIDEDGAAKRQKPKNNRGLKATLLAPKRGRSVERDRKERERGVEEERKERGRRVKREGHPEPRESGAGEVR